ncbi:MAG: PilT/PilU family type 4a pilus ATPase [Oscillospiraceae bacterium]|jgi:twitching motility protein PilT|nr:PilT/PilU family type 4a pilus ATPase [Oscillospiraceae bacterium]
MTFEEFIIAAREKNASDIHLSVGSEPVFRINGDLAKIDELSNVPVTNRMIIQLLNADQEERFNNGDDIDFVFELKSGARQRCNVFRQMGRLACAIRLLNSTIPSMEDLRLPLTLKELSKKRSGLILVTGVSGSGKTTTLSIILDFINATRPCHIITIEDPVEYRYEKRMATIHQREIGTDVKSFSTALRSALREDPDVIFVGEMRDYETMQLAVTAAETGHLVLATLHTRGAIHAVNRIIDACPHNIQQQMLVQLSQILECVISQSLMPLRDGSGRIAALEILLGTDACKNMIRSNKCHQLETIMQQGKSLGMSLMDDVIVDYYRNMLISKETALAYATDRVEMNAKL